MAWLATVLKPDDQMRKLGLAGRPALNVETGWVDHQDRRVPVGEVALRGLHLTPGYWKNP